MSKARLDNEFVRQLSAPKTYWDNDAKATGFGVRLYPSGVRSFFLNYWLHGVEKRFTIGQFPRWSTSAARERAIELRRQIDNGHDPAGDKRTRREAPTVADLVERYTIEHMPTKKLANKFRIKDEQRQLALIGDLLGNRTKVADIHGGDIRAMHRKITEERGPVRANRVLACVSKMFALSLVPLAGETLPWRNAVMGNPCKGIARNREEGRERFFSPAELTRIAEALNEYPRKAAADCLRLIMLTGCRPAEAMHATWTEFDRESGFWVKPSAHTKTQKIHRLPLSPPALQLIERLRSAREDNNFVFPGVPTLLNVWRFILSRAQLAPDERRRPARIYDLRHSFASLGVTQKLGLPLIGKLLGHTRASTTQKYAHVADDPLKEAADKIGNAIAGTAEQPDNVRKLR
jgi:integrase